MGSLRNDRGNTIAAAQRQRRGQTRPRRVLITGASGFVGAQVVRAALDRGHEVVAALRNRVSAAHLERAYPALRLLEADLDDSRSMHKLAESAAPDITLHLAWAIGPDCYDSPDNLTCVAGSLALLQGLVEAGCPRIVMAGTHLELAPDNGDLSEDQPVAPANLYAVCKDALNRMAGSRIEGSASSLVWARLFNLYGPGQADWALVSSIIRHLLEGRRFPLTHGEQVRTFMHVRDAAEALLDAAESSVRGIVHVGSDEVVTVRDLALRIGGRLGCADLLAFGQLEPSPRDAPRIVPSTRRLADIGFRPHWRLDDGLDDTIEWWRRQISSAVAT